MTVGGELSGVPGSVIRTSLTIAHLPGSCLLNARINQYACWRLRANVVLWSPLVISNDVLQIPLNGNTGMRLLMVSLLAIVHLAVLEFEMYSGGARRRT